MNMRWLKHFITKNNNKERRKKMINKLCDIYNRWGDKNNLQPLGSADEVILRNDLTVDQYAFLIQFIKVWDKAEERDYKMMSDERNKK